jgi:hypothetical protein
MKTSFFSFALLMIFSVTFSQNKATTFNIKDKVSLTLFDIDTTEEVEVYSLQKLGKTAWSDSFEKEKINLSPKKFNWYTDSKRIESIKNMTSTIQKQDFCGRDLLIDINSEVIQNVYNRNLYGR